MEIGRPQVKSLEEFQQHMENDQEIEGTSNLLLFHNKNENPASFRESYSAFTDWVHSALDIYQVLEVLQLIVTFISKNSFHYFILFLYIVI